MRTRGTVVLVLMAAALAAMPARSGARVLAHLSRTGPLELVGQSVLVAQGGGAIDAVSPSGTVSPVARGPDLGSTNFRPGQPNAFVFAASPQQLATEIEADDSYKSVDCFYACSWLLSTGPLDGPSAQVASCGTTPFGPPFAASGVLLAFGDEKCGTDAYYLWSLMLPQPVTSFIVRNVAGTATDLRIALPHGLTLAGLGLSGDVVAALTYPAKDGQPMSLLTWNATTGMPLLARQVPGVSGADAVAVQADGAVALDATKSPTNGCDTIRTMSPAGALHVIPGCANPIGLSLHDNRVTFIARDTVQTTDLAGEHLTSGLVLNHVPFGGFDSDGTNLVLSLPICAGRAALEETSLLSPVPSSLALRCPVHGLSVRAGRGGGVTVRFGCPQGCRARVALQVQALPRGDRGSRTFTSARRLAPGQTAVIHLRTPRPAASQAERLTAEISTRDLAGDFRAVARRSVTLAARS